MKRAARSIRNGSSLKLTSGPSGVRSTLRIRSTAPPNGSTSVGACPAVTSSAIALIVKSRRLRSVSISSAYVTCGLRESSVYDSARNVVISYTRSPRLAPIVPNRSPCVQIASAQPVEARLDRVGAGVGGEVEVEVVAAVVDQQIADAAADQVQAVPARANRSASGASSASTGAKRSGIMARPG